MTPPKLRLLPTEESVAESAGPELEPSYAFVLRLKEGDPDALRTLYIEHHRDLRRLGRRLLGNADDAEDLLHEVFLALPDSLRRYRGDCTLRTFLTSVALKRASKRLRGLGRLRRAIAQLTHRHEADQSEEDARGDSAELRQLSGLLSEEIVRLPFPQRSVVVLCLIEERPAAEVAALLGIPRARCARDSFTPGSSCASGSRTIDDLGEFREGSRGAPRGFPGRSGERPPDLATHRGLSAAPALEPVAPARRAHLLRGRRRCQHSRALACASLAKRPGRTGGRRPSARHADRYRGSSPASLDAGSSGIASLCAEGRGTRLRRHDRALPRVRRKCSDGVSSERPASELPASDPQDALFDEVRRTQARARPGEALAGWERYLAAFPHGRFAPEARFGRAVALAKLGRNAEASQAFLWFAEGTEDGYRAAESVRWMYAIAEDQ